MGYVILWIVMGIIVAMIARSKGLSAIGWFIYGALIWPIALVHALLIKPSTGTIAPVPETSAATGAAARFLEEDRPCPHCAERIKKAAKICRFCNRAVEPEQAPLRLSS